MSLINSDLAADVYDPTLNPLYPDVLRHYGAVAVPCRVRHSDRKGTSSPTSMPSYRNAPLGDAQ